MENNLKEIFQIQKVLDHTGYLDISRISKEISDYCKDNPKLLEKTLKRIEKSEPWEYIRGKTEFRGEDFFVNTNVLIPRVETEEIVNIAENFLNKNKNFNSIIDIGTGSGCIIISLAKDLCAKNRYSFLGTDINLKALKVTRENCMLHKVNKKVLLQKANLLNNVKIDSNKLIIANLPYIPKDMYRNLDRSVKNFEPKNALEGGSDGLKYYKRIKKQIENKKRPKIHIALLIEIEPSTLQAVEELFQEYKIQTFKDFRDKNRFLLIHFS